MDQIIEASADIPLIVDLDGTLIKVDSLHELLSRDEAADMASRSEHPAPMNDINPNWVAYLALLSWPVVALYFYSRLPVVQATLLTILGGYLLLPELAEIKVEMVPAFNKYSIPNLAALIGCALCARRSLKFSYGFGLAEVLLLLILVGPFITGVLNADPTGVGTALRPGVGAYDAGSAAIAQSIYILPFFFGRQFMRNAEDNAEILRIMVFAGLAYSLPMLFEVRMSPQLSAWIYGFRTQFYYKYARRRFSARGLPYERAGGGLFRHDNSRGCSRLVADANPHRPIAARCDHGLFEFCIAAVQNHGCACVRHLAATFGPLGEPTFAASRCVRSRHNSIELSDASRGGPGSYKLYA